MMFLHALCNSGEKQTIYTATLTCSSPFAYKYVCFAVFYSFAEVNVANSVDLHKTAPHRAVSTVSTMFACMLKIMCCLRERLWNFTLFASGSENVHLRNNFIFRRLMNI